MSDGERRKWIWMLFPGLDESTDLDEWYELYKKGLNWPRKDPEQTRKEKLMKNRDYYRRHRAEILEKKRQYDHANRERIRERKRAYLREYYQKNREKIRAYAKESYQNNIEKKRAYMSVYARRKSKTLDGGAI